MIIPRLGYDIRRAPPPTGAGEFDCSLPPPTVTAEDRVPSGDQGNDTAADTPGEDPHPVTCA